MKKCPKCGTEFSDIIFHMFDKCLKCGNPDFDDKEPLLPPSNVKAKNYSDMGMVCSVIQYTIASWTPERDGKGKCTQVHVMFEIDLPSIPKIVLRLKSKGACDILIAALQRHRKDVWGTE